ncbi:MAG: FAD-dependent oxidoreductase, partial [Bacteroidota bacterium]
GTPALEYGSMSNEALIAAMLAELDEEFDGAATANYIQHTRQFWNDEPHINDAYVYDYENWQRVRDLGDSVDDKIYFAGDAYTDGEDWSSVHTAILSAKRAVEELVEVGFG